MSLPSGPVRPQQMPAVLALHTLMHPGDAPPYLLGLILGVEAVFLPFRHDCFGNA